MSYKIQYTPQDNRRYPQKHYRYKIRWSKVAMVLGFIVVALWISIQGLPDIFVSPELERTKTAAQIMIENVREGESVEQAVLAFCKQIVHSEAQ